MPRDTCRAARWITACVSCRWKRKISASMENNLTVPTAPAPPPLIRMRLSLALVAAVGIALELALMRGLAIRFSSHFAGIVISVGLLGFGAAGSFLTLFRKVTMRHQRSA